MVGLGVVNVRGRWGSGCGGILFDRCAVFFCYAAVGMRHVVGSGGLVVVYAIQYLLFGRGVCVPLVVFCCAAVLLCCCCASVLLLCSCAALCCCALLRLLSSCLCVCPGAFSCFILPSVLTASFSPFGVYIFILASAISALTPASLAQPRRILVRPSARPTPY